MKVGRPNRFEAKPKAPKDVCRVCEKKVSPRRAVQLMYPEITLCEPCHATNIDCLDKLSDEYDDHKVCVRKKKKKFDYHFIAVDLWKKRSFRAMITTDTQAVTYGRTSLRDGESLLSVFNATTNTRVTFAGMK